MIDLYSIALIGIIVGIVAFALNAFWSHSTNEEGRGPHDLTTYGYLYKKKEYFLTQTEREFYKILVEALGGEYLIFAQVQLSALVDNHIVGQNWLYALRNTNQKSIDFILCDKTDMTVKLAIELDDKTHDLPERHKRDIEVERVLLLGEVPLLRVAYHEHFEPNELKHKILALTGK